MKPILVSCLCIYAHSIVFRSVSATNWRIVWLGQLEFDGNISLKHFSRIKSCFASYFQSNFDLLFRFQLTALDFGSFFIWLHFFRMISFFFCFRIFKLESQKRKPVTHTAQLNVFVCIIIIVITWFVVIWIDDLEFNATLFNLINVIESMKSRLLCELFTRYHFHEGKNQKRVMFNVHVWCPLWKWEEKNTKINYYFIWNACNWKISVKRFGNWFVCSQMKLLSVHHLTIVHTSY